MISIFYAFMKEEEVKLAYPCDQPDLFYDLKTQGKYNRSFFFFYGKTSSECTAGTRDQIVALSLVKTSPP